MIYADENVWMPVVEGLRQRGWDVTSALDEGMLGRSDGEQLRYAADRNWCVLTFDDDFLSLVETTFADVDHGGLVFIEQHGRDVGELVKRIDRALHRNHGRDLSGEIVFA